MLTAIKVIDDSSRAGAAELTIGSELGDFFGTRGVGDSGRIMPQSLGADTGPGANPSSRKGAGICKGDFLFDTSVAASTKRSGSVVGAWIDIILDHANSICELVGIQLVPLVRCQGTLVAGGSAKVIADFRCNYNTSKVSTRGAVECRELHAALRYNESGEGNSVTI